MANRYFEGKKQGPSLTAILNAIHGVEVDQRGSIDSKNWIIMLADGVSYPPGILNRFTELTHAEAITKAESDEYQNNATMIVA